MTTIRTTEEVEYEARLRAAFVAALELDNPRAFPGDRAALLYSRTVTRARPPILPPEIAERIRFETLPPALEALGIPLPRNPEENIPASRRTARFDPNSLRKEHAA